MLWPRSRASAVERLRRVEDLLADLFGEILQAFGAQQRLLFYFERRFFSEQTSAFDAQVFDLVAGDTPVSARQQNADQEHDVGRGHDVEHVRADDRHRDVPVMHQHREQCQYHRDHEDDE